jgi:sulfur carrier protein
VPDSATVSTLAQLLGVPERGSAVAVDGVVVRRADWDSCTLRDGQAVEVVHAVQGG